MVFYSIDSIMVRFTIAVIETDSSLEWFPQLLFLETQPPYQWFFSLPVESSCFTIVATIDLKENSKLESIAVYADYDHHLSTILVVSIGSSWVRLLDFVVF